MIIGGILIIFFSAIFWMIGFAIGYGVGYATAHEETNNAHVEGGETDTMVEDYPRIDSSKYLSL